MKLIVGLGNPGKKYEGSRHNAGFIVLDKLAQQLGIKNYELRKKFFSEIAQTKNAVLVRPQTFMNKSGDAVGKLVKFYKVELEDLYIVHDDLDIVLGKYKIQLGKGPRVHNGLQSIYENLDTKDFWHVRVGIENRGRVPNLSGLSHQSRSVRDDKPALTSLAGLSRQNKWRISGEKFVLQRFTKEEREVFNQVMKRAIEELLKCYLLR